MVSSINNSYGYGVSDAGMVDSLFFAGMGGQQAQLEEMSNTALSSGIDKYMQKDYEGAAEDFRRAVGIAPQSENSVAAANYMADAYLKIGEPEKAVNAYKTSISLNPNRDDTYLKLGNLFFSLGRYTEAEAEYTAAVNLNPGATNIFSLGQLYLSTDRLGEAVEQFEKVVDLTPENVNGYYGLGQAYGKMGDYEEAVKQFEKSIGLQEDFYNSYAELGYVYADMGETEKAQEIFELLEEKDPGLADTLSRYMYKVEAPRIEFATFDSTFEYALPAKSRVSVLDSYLENANTSKTFTMVFQFGKAMDSESVQNRFNWQISRSTKIDPGQRYNDGLSVPSTEITVSPLPKHITYDSSNYQVTVYFSISQNSALADGTLDPSHLIFKFSGTDESGNSMDPDADEFMGAVGAV